MTEQFEEDCGMFRFRGQTWRHTWVWSRLVSLHPDPVSALSRYSSRDVRRECVGYTNSTTYKYFSNTIFCGRSSEAF